MKEGQNRHVITPSPRAVLHSHSLYNFNGLVLLEFKLVGPFTFWREKFFKKQKIQIVEKKFLITQFFLLTFKKAKCLFDLKIKVHFK